MAVAVARSERWPWLVLGAVAVCSLAILFLFDPARTRLYPVCPFHQWTGLLCPGCGGLRCVHHLLHGEVALAFRYHPLLVLLSPLVTGLTVFMMIRKRKTHRATMDTRLLWALLVMVIAFTVWRNLPGNRFGILP